MPWSRHCPESPATYLILMGYLRWFTAIAVERYFVKSRQAAILSRRCEL